MDSSLGLMPDIMAEYKFLGRKRVLCKKYPLNAERKSPGIVVIVSQDVPKELEGRFEFGRVC